MAPRRCPGGGEVVVDGETGVLIPRQFTPGELFAALDFLLAVEGVDPKRTGITGGFEPAGGGYAEYVRVMPFCLPGVVRIPRANTFAEGAMLEPVKLIL